MHADTIRDVKEWANWELNSHGLYEADKAIWLGEGESRLIGLLEELIEEI